MKDIRRHIFQNGNKEQRSIVYNNYLSSQEWKTIASFVKLRDDECIDCGSLSSLEVHHLTYNNVFDEAHHLDDLITLCRVCHSKRHDKTDYSGLYTQEQQKIMDELQSINNDIMPISEKIDLIKVQRAKWKQMYNRLSREGEVRLLYAQEKNGGIMSDSELAKYAHTVIGGVSSSGLNMKQMLR